MATYLLDTSILIDVLNDKKGRKLLLRELVMQDHVLACCSINVAEVYAGIRPGEEQKTENLLRSLQYFPITFAVAELGGNLKRTFSGRGSTLSLSDVLIAAVAMENGHTLITDNAKDFPMKELRLFPLPKG